jgi:hypothetical protein
MKHDGLGDFNVAKLNKRKQGMCQIVALSVTLRKYLKSKRRNSNISPGKNIALKNSSKRNQNLSKYYDSMIDLEFKHKSKYHFSNILK